MFCKVCRNNSGADHLPNKVHFPHKWLYWLSEDSDILYAKILPKYIAQYVSKPSKLTLTISSPSLHEF